MFRAALHMVINDFKVFIVFVALGLPFSQVHLSGEMGMGGLNRLPANTSCGISTGPASLHNNTLSHGNLTNDDVGLHE